MRSFQPFLMTTGPPFPVPLLASSAYTRTPPTASVMFLNPSKLVFATWWMRILSRFSMVCTSSGSRPKAYAALILFLPCPGMST